MILLEIILAWFLADIFTGIIHWWEDRYLSIYLKGFIGQLAYDNFLHHVTPESITHFTVWENIKYSAITGWPLAFVLYLIGAPIFIWLTLLFSTFGNVIHRFAHSPMTALPWWILFMQSLGVFITADHHKDHHYDYRGKIKKEDTTIKFCVMTNWMNPILDFFEVFVLLEWALEKFGIKRIEG